MTVFCFQVPSTENEWCQVADEFERHWNFPNCLGALDGKHIAIMAPCNSGSLYYNYKNFFSVVLLALVDARYRFLYVDVGSYGRVSDGGVFNGSSLAQALAQNSLHIPPSRCLPNSDTRVPFVVVADDAFASKPHLLKPYSMRNCTEEQRVFNYRLSRARRVVENAFGILSQRFLVFKKPLGLNPEKVQVVVMAACCLHNFLLSSVHSGAAYAAVESPEHVTDNCMQPLCSQGSNHSSSDAMTVRNSFCSYFNSENGKLSWQQRASR